MSSFEEKCSQYFGTINYYELLGVEKTSSAKEIKKAYHKLSLLVHPDRVSENHKEIATEKFKVLGRIHSILQDKAKREIYDEYGKFDDDDDDVGDSTFNWTEYWMSMFRTIDLDAIKKYEDEYIGSESELRDIKRAYQGSKGNMNAILEMVPFSSCESEERIIEIVRDMVNNGEVEEYKSFFNESKVKKMRRHKRWEKERKEVELLDMTERDKELESRIKKRAEDFGNFISDLEKKYAPRKKVRNSIGDGKTKKSVKK